MKLQTTWTFRLYTVSYFSPSGAISLCGMQSFFESRLHLWYVVINIWMYISFKFLCYQYCSSILYGHWTSLQIRVTVSKGFNYEVCTYIGEHFLLVCWLSGLFAVPDPFYEENLFLRTLLYSTWLWLRILISGPSFKFDSVEWCRKLPIPRSIDWDEKFNKTEGKGDGRTSSNIYRLIRPRSKVCVERRLRK